MGRVYVHFSKAVQSQSKADWEGVIAPFPRYEVLKSPFLEFAFSPGKHLVFAKQWVVKIPVCGRLS